MCPLDWGGSLVDRTYKGLVFAPVLQHFFCHDSIHLSTLLYNHQSVSFLGAFSSKLQTSVCLSVGISASLPLSSEPCLFTAIFFGYKLYIQWNTPIRFFPSHVDLQCCVTFCFTAKWFSYTHACVYVHCVCVCVCVCVHILLFRSFFLSFFVYSVWYAASVAWPGIEPASPQVEVWTGREVAHIFFCIMIYHRIWNIILCPLQK